MNGWRVLLVVLVMGNVGLLAQGFLGSTSTLHTNYTPGLRADWVEVQRPWIQQAVDAALPEQPVIPKINLKKGQANLTLAIENANQQMLKASKSNQQCRLWGPLLQSESARVQESLASWDGKMNRLEKQVLVGYVLYLPQEVVSNGVGVKQLIKQLSGKGLSSLSYVTTPGPLQGTITLGFFRELDRVNAQRADFLRRGIPGVQVFERFGPARIYFELRGTEDQIESATSIFKLNRKSELTPCKG